MNGSKYVILMNQGLETPFIFPPWISHDTVLKMFDKSMIVSAGFVSIRKDGIIEVFGFSESLNVSSRPLDKQVIIMTLMRGSGGGVF